jgi:NADH-quinone oxidoreductase subunit C
MVDRLSEHFGTAAFTHERLWDTLCITVPKEQAHAMLAFMKEDLGFHFLTSLCGMHFPGTEQELGVVYFLHDMRHGHRIRVKTGMTLPTAELPTVTDLWPSANWMERETWDFFGIRFTGHPNLKRILNMEDFPAFPLRKEYPLEDPTREDKDNTFFGR